MSKKINPIAFEDAMRNVTKTISREADLQVIVSGDKAYTSGNVVVVPSVDHTKDLDISEARVARGYVDHETAHRLYTDLDGDWMSKAQAHSSLCEALTQTMEDVRIERLHQQNYHGTRENLTATANATYEHVVQELAGDDVDLDDENALLPLAITMYGRQQNELEIETANVEGIEKHLSEEVKKKAKYLADVATQRAATTGDVFRLAKKFCVEEEGSDDNPPPPPEGVKSDGEGEVVSTEGEGDGEVNQGNPNGAGGLGPQYVNHDLSQGVDKTFEKEEYDPNGLMQDIPFICDYSQDVEIRRDGAFYGDGLEVVGRDNDVRMFHNISDAGREKSRLAYRQIIKSIGPQLGRVKQTFERYLMTLMQTDWKTGLTEGMIDPRRLASVPLGNEYVWRQMEDDLEVDTAVSILVDLSGSMSGSRITLARKACIALAESLRKVGIPFEITGHCTLELLGSRDRTDPHWTAYRNTPLIPPSFDRMGELPLDQGINVLGEPTVYIGPDYLDDSKGLLRAPGNKTAFEPVEYSRLQNENAFKYRKVTRLVEVGLVVFKEFRQKLHDAESQIASMPEFVTGATAEGCGVLKTFARLEKRQERKKVIVVLSDGSPGSYSVADDGIHLGNVVKMIEARPDFDIMQIGIESNAGKRYYSNCIPLNDIEELPKVLMENVKKMVTVKKAA